MTVKQTLKQAAKKLAARGIDSSALDADILLSFVLKKPKEFLYTEPEKKLTKSQLTRFNQLINRRAKREPVAYLTHHKEFFGLDFFVAQDVLIPRPLTESLVEKIIKEVKNKKVVIADIGTGSGCIAIALKKHLPNATVYATDISYAALKVARKNARKHGVKVKFFQGNLLEPLENKKIDYIVANLPYLHKNQIKNELKYEPTTALLGGDKYIKQLLKQVKKLNPPSANWRSGQPKKIFLETEN